MKIRIYNARMLPMKEDLKIMEGEILIDGERISYVGSSQGAKVKAVKEEILSESAWDREIDARGNLVMPGFKDAHTHSGMTFLRSFADDLPLDDWLHQQIFPMEAKLTQEDIYHLSKLAILEYLSGGITGNFDMYLTPDTIAQASLDCGFRTVLTSGLNDFTSSVEDVDRLYQTYNQPGSLISFRLGFHGEYTNCLKNMEGIASLAEKHQAPVYMHSSETVGEVRGCQERYHLTPTALFDKLGIYRYGGGGYHCVHMTEEDLEIFQKNQLWVITNPGSNTKLASGIAPIQKMLSMDIPIALGTDGPASNNCLDMFREMFLVTGLAKLRERDASAVDADEVLRMATIGGAKAMGLNDCDCLAPGKYADLIVIDLHQPNLQPINNITKNLVYSGSKSDVKLTMINGKILYEEGNYYVGCDPEEIYRKCNDIVDRIRRQL